MKTPITTTIIVAAVLLYCLPTISLAQTGGANGTYARIGMSPRTIAIGNAYTAGGAEGIYTAYNPAMAARVRHNQVDFSGASMSFDRSLATVNLTFPLPPNAGLALGLVYAGVRDFDGRTQSGYFTDRFSTHDLQFIGSFGLQVSAGMMAGVNVKFQTSRYNEKVTPPVSFGIDIGLIYNWNRYTQLGFVVQDMLANYIWDTQELYGTVGSNQTTDKMPTRFKLGIRHSLPAIPINFYGEVEHRLTHSEVYDNRLFLDNGRPVVRTIRLNSSTASQYIRLGSSYDVHERITVRAGWQSGHLTFIDIDQQFSAGFSLHLPFDALRPSIDYALVREPSGVSWMHMFSLRLNFND